MPPAPFLSVVVPVRNEGVRNEGASILPLVAEIRAAVGAAEIIYVDDGSTGVANRVRAGLPGGATPDTGCGLKAFRREAFLDLPQFDHVHRFLPALVLRAGGRVVSVPARYRPRLRGRSKHGVLDRLWVGVFDLAGVFWLQRRWRRPEVEEP